MQQFYYRCAALLLAVGLIFPCTTALAYMPEQGPMAVGLSAVDSSHDSGSAITYTAPWNEDEPFCTTTRAEWTLDMLPKPEMGWLFPVDKVGNWDEVREFYIEWSRSDYDAGLASGAERFIITGRYVPANAKDQALWDKDLLRVDETCVPRMEVKVTNATALPFRVELGRNEAVDGYYPIFAFPLPHGASKVRFEASDDGVNWFICTQRYNDTGAFTQPSNTYSMHYAIFTEDGEPYFFDAHKKSYYRVTVYGSAYDANGGGAQSTFTLDAVSGGTKPPGSNLDNTGGNRGGGAQGETERPGKVEEEPEAGKVTIELTPNSQPEYRPVLAQSSPRTEQAPPAAASQQSGTASTESGADIAEPVSSASREPSAQETLASAVEEPPSAESQPPHNQGNAGTVLAVTAGILIAGALGSMGWNSRKR